MQSFDEYKILDDKLSEVESITLQISNVLLNDVYTGFDYIQNLDRLYNNRKDAIKSLESVIKIVNTKDDKLISYRIQKLIESDKNILDGVNRKVNEIRLKLRNFGKQKAVLLYTKDL
jgi:hypothetical protein